MANRLAARIREVRERLVTLSPEQRDKLDHNLDLDPGEHFAYQQQQSRAHAMGTISADEAQIMYVALGEVGSRKNGGWASGTDLATKIVVTQGVYDLTGPAREAAQRRKLGGGRGRTRLQGRAARVAAWGQRR